MRCELGLCIAMWMALIAGASVAQDMRWIQIEAQPSLLEAETRARIYAQEFPDTQAHSIGSGWYAITLGPLPEDQADLRMSQLRARAAIPRGSFLATGANYRQRIYPIGPTPTAVTPAQTAKADVVQEEAAQVSVSETVESAAPEPSITVPDETLSEARASEGLLSSEEKMDLQRYLQWAGYYNSTIDASIGRGTRRAMAAWQTDNGYEDTGVLTTAQRQRLRAQYFAIFDGLGLETHRDLEAGISIDLPKEVVAFDAYAAPLAHFKSQETSSPAHVFLISAAGNRGDLAAIYGVLPTLSIVPMNIEKSLNKDRFVITGAGTTTRTFITASHASGEIKGFGLIWPNQNEEQFDRLVVHMRKSFDTFSGTLDPSLSVAINDPETEFGVAIRKPAFVKSAVFVSDQGHAITDTSDLEQCSALTIGGTYDAEIIARSETGAGLLSPKSDFNPISYAKLGNAVRKGDKTFLSSYPYGGRLGLASVTQATVAETSDLSGNTEKFRLDFLAEPGDFGGAILDQSGNLTGILVSQDDTGRVLPKNVNFAAASDALASMMQSAGLRLSSGKTQRLDDMALIASAQNILTPIECWID
ncbi:MAG: peptidoglycan-binding protein [Rhodobacteraceae bacterium]|nr:peptidoglycan-binding protein [Paracoccaceae bacterium]